MRTVLETSFLLVSSILGLAVVLALAAEFLDFRDPAERDRPTPEDRRAPRG